ncbi:hypothetical protein [Tumebacillus sp. BK434]|uniref:hypothetical protein n=1 Tax=Tumebacillus sp. BK434 TaxID=2512169 RepID=UPI00104602BA|nr:hypothetical protein [Tumebacillus sp. BK434]
MGVENEPHDQAEQEAALELVRAAAVAAGTAVILGMEWGPNLVAMVIDEAGNVLGYQAKNQIAVKEENTRFPTGIARFLRTKAFRLASRSDMELGAIRRRYAGRRNAGRRSCSIRR